MIHAYIAILYIDGQTHSDTDTKRYMNIHISAARATNNETINNIQDCTLLNTLPYASITFENVGIQYNNKSQKVSTPGYILYLQ